MKFLFGLILFRLSLSWAEPHPWLILVFDGLLMFSLVGLLRRIQIPQAIEAWRFLRYREHKRKKLQFNLALGLDAIRMLSLVFVTLWYGRWSELDLGLEVLWPGEQDFAYIDAFFLCTLMIQAVTARKLSRWLSKVSMTSGRQALLHYLGAAFLGAILLLMPFSLKADESLSLLDALFVAVSGLTVTGLSPVNIGEVLSFPGQLILLLLIQMGGLGIIMVTVALSIATGSRLSLGSIQLGQTVYGSQTAGRMPRFLGKVVAATLAFETIGAGLLYFSLPADTENRLFSAIFHSVSAFCNAGFSLYSDSLHSSPFFSGGIFVVCTLIMLGGLGFPILFDLAQALNRRGFTWERLSHHSKLAIAVTVSLWVVGAFILYLLDQLHPAPGLEGFKQLGNAIFYSITTRSAGFNMLPVVDMHPSSIFFLMVLMVIGVSPGSTGGGIKVTTLGVLLVTAYQTLLNRPQSVFMGRAISFNVVKRALTIVIIYILVAGAGVFVLGISEDLPLASLAFEVVSALSTVGLSLGATAELTPFGKLVIMCLMLFGRVGILTILLAGLGEKRESHIRYPEDDIFVG